MYARSGGRTLLSVVRTYGQGPLDIRSTNHTSRRTWDHRTYATFEYPLGNTWTYETPFGPLGKDHRTYDRVAKRPLVL